MMYNKNNNNHREVRNGNSEWTPKKSDEKTLNFEPLFYTLKNQHT